MAEPISLRTRSKFGDDAPDMLYEYLTPLRRFLTDPAVDEVVVNRPGEVWTEGRDGWVRHDEPLLTFDYCKSLATLIAAFNHKAIDEDKPVLSASLIYRERAQVLIPPACETGTISITIRKPGLSEYTLDELEAQGAFNEAQHLPSRLPEGVKTSVSANEQFLLDRLAERDFKTFLEEAVKRHQTILIAGKTGSGKTTISKSLVRCIPHHERLITIEDVNELFLRGHKNKVHLFFGRADEGGTKVSPRQALASCLRMKPDRILLAELRGPEAWDFIDAINTGHPGSISTLHANGAVETFNRLAMLAKQSEVGSQLDTEYIKHMLYTTVDVVLYYKQRKLMEVYFDPGFKRQQMG